MLGCYQAGKKKTYFLVRLRRHRTTSATTTSTTSSSIQGRESRRLFPDSRSSAESNTDATVWTFKLRPGVEWHDGKPFGADDVVYNFQTLWSNANLNYSSGILAGLVNFPAIKAVDKLTVQVPLLQPVAHFPTLFTFYNFPIVQNGATVASSAVEPIGTGPFKFVSFTPGTQSVFEKNPNYWESGKPYVDRLVVDSSFSDTTSLFNALLSGKINLYPTLPFVNARQQLATKQVQILKHPLRPRAICLQCGSIKVRLRTIGSVKASSFSSTAKP